MVKPAKKTTYRRLVWTGVLLAFLVIATLAVWGTKSPRAPANIDAAQLVRSVRESENWIHDVNSLLIRVESKWTKTAEGIAARRAELKKQEPNLKPDPNRFWGLKTGYAETLEYAIDRRTIEQRKLRSLEDTPGRSSRLMIWNGKESFLHYKDVVHKRESYSIDNDTEGLELFIGMSWPRAQPHLFWYDPNAVQENMKYWGRAEDFAFKGYAEYRGVDCYILECEPPALSGRTRRWYVGKDDNLLYGLVKLDGSKKSVEHWTLDYNEVAPGCWYPMTQGYELYDHKWWGTVGFLDSRRDLKVVEVQVNEPLPDELFEMKFKEGVRVIDERSLPE